MAVKKANPSAVAVRRHRAVVFCLLCLLAGLAPAWHAQADPVPVALEPALSGLAQAKNFRSKEEAVQVLTQVSDERVLPILEALLDGQLYVRKRDRRAVLVKKGDDDYLLLDPLTGAELGQAGRRDVKKISINNKVRGWLRRAIAERSIGSDDVAQRRAAVDRMIKKLTADTEPTLRDALAKETDADVRARLTTALALIEVDDADAAKRLAAVQILGDSLYSEVRNRLALMLQQDADGKYNEADPQVRAAARRALERVESRRGFYEFIKTLFFGLSQGSVLLLIAIGLAITFGVMGVINMAHGAIMMLGAYATYFVQQWVPLDISLLVAIPAAFLLSGLVGVAMERTIVRYLYGRPLDTLLATFGVGLVIEQLVRTMVSAKNVPVQTPSWMSGSWQVNPALDITYTRLYIIIFSILVFLFLLFVLKKTSLGLQVRAVSQNRAMAKAMGIRSEWVDALTFGLGSGIAGVAGVALSQIDIVGPNLGQSYIIESFMVVVFGGVGNLWGTLVGGMSLGVANKFIEPDYGAVWAQILILVFIVLFIQRRPRGLFPQKGRAAEN